MARPRGKKPLPTRLKLVKGTLRKDRANPKEPMPDLHLPMPPEHLHDIAKVEWGRKSDELYRLGLLTNLDSAIFACYCQAYAMWVVAERVLAKMAKLDEMSEGLMVRTINGNTIQNPILGVANKARADVARYATDLGMTPSARSRIETQAPSKDTDKASKYFTG